MQGFAHHPTVFMAEPWRAVQLQAADVPALQSFFDANPSYFQGVHGQPPLPGEAQQEFDDLPPAGMGYTNRWLLAFLDDSGAMVAMATVLSDFIAPGVWHVGLFIVADALHGGGAAPACYAALERWMLASGAVWLRLGVVQGRERAERFWRRHGYQQLRERGPTPMGLQTNMLRVLMKPLRGGDVASYLALVARDRPGAA